MLKKLAADLTRKPRIYELAPEMHERQLGPYYFLFREQRIASGADQALIRRFDDNGIPINRTYIDVDGVDYVYYPISIGQLGLAVFHTALATRRDEDRERFLKFVEWFAGNGTELSGGGVCWMTHVPLPQYRHPGPWPSAFAQSRALSILLRGFQLSGDLRYARLAERALIPFTRPVEQGGVTAHTPWGPFYEEYPAGMPTLVLNGKIFALCGLYDFVRVFPQEVLARRLFDEGIETLIRILPEYDLGFWSRYNLCRAPWYPEIDPSTVSYQHLHALQCEFLGRLTGRQLFFEFARRFHDQVRPINVVRSLWLKGRALRKLNRL